MITTIHQPQSEIFAAFDNLILMRKGSMVYQGNAKRAVSYFEKLGFSLPAQTNPADHLIDILSESDIGASLSIYGDYIIGEDNVTARLSKIDSVKFVVSEKTKQIGSQFVAEFPEKHVQPWHVQFAVLLERNMKFHFRQPEIFLMNACLTVLIAVCAGTSVFRDMKTNKAAASLRPNFFFFCVTHQGVVAAIQVQITISFFLI